MEIKCYSTGSMYWTPGVGQIKVTSDKRQDGWSSKVSENYECRVIA